MHGDKLDEGQHSPDGVGMRFTNEGLAGLGPVIQSLASGAFDVGGLLMAQNPIINQQDAFLTLDIIGNVYEAGIGGVSLDAASTDPGVQTAITIDDLYVGVNLHITDGLTINIDCGLELQIPSTTIDATFDLEPTAGDESKVDVNLVGAPAVDTATVDYEFISGICDGQTFLVGDIVDAVAGPQVQTLVGEGFATNLDDPDGTGPADSPIADAIQAHLDAPFTRIDETSTAMDFRGDADFFATPGASPTDCVPAPGAPDLASTYDVPGEYPELGVTTPGGDPYGLGLVISASAFNRLLGAMAECGILNQTVTEFPLGGQSLPKTSTLLAAIIPEFRTKLPPNTPLAVRVTPTVAPFLTRRQQQGGDQRPNIEELFPSFVDAVGDSFAAFPLPAFLDLRLEVLEVAREGNYFVLHANLDPRAADPHRERSGHRPEQRRQRGRLDLRRERVAAPHPPVGVTHPPGHQPQGDDRRRRLLHRRRREQVGACRLPADVRRRARERRDVDPRPAPPHPGCAHAHRREGAPRGRRWRDPLPDTDHRPRPCRRRCLAGLRCHGHARVGGARALRRRRDDQSRVHRVQRPGAHGDDRRDDHRGVRLRHVRNSNSNAFFPAAGGDEASIRFGANDTITNGFAAGGYPGQGNRNLLTDGHFAEVELTTTP